MCGAPPYQLHFVSVKNTDVAYSDSGKTLMQLGCQLVTPIWNRVKKPTLGWYFELSGPASEHLSFCNKAIGYRAGVVKLSKIEIWFCSQACNSDASRSSLYLWPDFLYTTLHHIVCLCQQHNNSRLHPVHHCLADSTSLLSYWWLRLQTVFVVYVNGGGKLMDFTEKGRIVKQVRRVWQS